VGYYLGHYKMAKKPVSINDLPALLDPSPFGVLKRQVDGLKALSKEEKLSVLFASSFAALQSVNFDEAWYLSAYPDIALAVKNGAFTSGLHHYRSLGFFEGRLPVDINVDDEFYCQLYPDVTRAISMGQVAGAKLHFVTRGYHEGRIPSATYSFIDQESVELMKKIKKRVFDSFQSAVEPAKIAGRV
jgi:hypothetical protein